MGVSQILDEIKSLPAEERWEVLARTRELLGPEVPKRAPQPLTDQALDDCTCWLTLAPASAGDHTTGQPRAGVPARLGGEIVRVRVHDDAAADD